MVSPPAFWDGFDSEIAAVPGELGFLRVRIYPKADDDVPGPAGRPPRRPQAAWVIVGKAEPLRAVHFIPPERPHPGLDRADYERRAVELVRRHLAPSRPFGIDRVLDVRQPVRHRLDRLAAFTPSGQ